MKTNRLIIAVILLNLCGIVAFAVFRIGSVASNHPNQSSRTIEARNPDRTRPPFVIPERPSQPSPDSKAASDFGGLRSEAFIVVEDVVKRLKDSPGALCLLGKLHLRSGNSEVAKRIWEYALGVDPNFGEAWLDLGNAVLLLGDQEIAEQHFRNAAKCSKDPTDGLFALGKVLLDQGKLAEAVQQFNLLLNRNPTKVAAICKLGVAYQQLGRFSNAIEEYSKALQIDKDSWEAIVGLQTAYRSAGDTANAKKYAELMSDPRRSLRGKADIDIERSIEYFSFICQSASNLLLEGGDVTAASAILKRALELAPDSDQMRRQLVNIYTSQGNHDAAVNVLKTRCDLSTGTLEAWMNLAVYSMKVRKLEIAEEALRKAIALDPKQSDSYALLAQIQMTRTKDKPLAVETAKRAVELAPIASNHFILATALYHIEDLAGARKELTEALRLEPNNQEFRDAFARLPTPR